MKYTTIRNYALGLGLFLTPLANAGNSDLILEASSTKNPQIYQSIIRAFSPKIQKLAASVEVYDSNNDKKRSKGDLIEVYNNAGQKIAEGKQRKISIKDPKKKKSNPTKVNTKVNTKSAKWVYETRNMIGLTPGSVSQTSSFVNGLGESTQYNPSGKLSGYQLRTVHDFIYQKYGDALKHILGFEFDSSSEKDNLETLRRNISEAAYAFAYGLEGKTWEAKVKIGGKTFDRTTDLTRGPITSKKDEKLSGLELRAQLIEKGWILEASSENLSGEGDNTTETPFGSTSFTSDVTRKVKSVSLGKFILGGPRKSHLLAQMGVVSTNESQSTQVPGVNEELAHDAMSISVSGRVDIKNGLAASAGLEFLLPMTGRAGDSQDLSEFTSKGIYFTGNLHSDWMTRRTPLTQVEQNAKFVKGNTTTARALMDVEVEPNGNTITAKTLLDEPYNMSSGKVKKFLRKIAGWTKEEAKKAVDHFKK